MAESEEQRQPEAGSNLGSLLCVPGWGLLTGSSAASFSPVWPKGVYGGCGLLPKKQW